MSNQINNLYEFGKFRFNSKSNTLWRGNEVVALPPKALELLKLLIEKQGEVVSKQEIFDTVWADTFVEEGVLTQNIYTLRQTLGTDENGKQLIENLARRGYRLTVPVSLEIEKNQSEPVISGLPLQQPKPVAGAFSGYVVIPAIIICLSLSGFFGYRYLFSGASETSSSSIGELKFKQLTDTGDVSYLTISPDGNRVAYTRGFDLYFRNLETDQETKLKLENTSKIGCLQFSPVEEKIYFSNIFDRDDKGNIYRVGHTGGVPETVAENVWSGFSISPDGQELAFVRKLPDENKQVLVVKNLKNGEEKNLKSINLPEEFYWNNYPAWSADGQKIALVVITQTEHFSRLWLIDSKSGAEQELRPKNFRNIEQVVFNADGSSLIAAANDGNNFQIWKISVEDESVKRITNDLNSYLGISISQDRKKLISRQRIYFSNIWVAEKDDLVSLKQMTEGTSRNDGLLGLAWLDEEKIIYTSNDEKIRDWNLWLLNTADKAKQKLTSDRETQNDYPAVSPDRKFIYFASDRNKETRIWRINADGTEPTQMTFGEDETHHFPQISADGKWLYFIIKSGRSSNIGRKSLFENSIQELSGDKKYVAGNFLSISPDSELLAFQNIGNTDRTKFQLALVSTKNPGKVDYKEIDAWRQMVKWSADGKSFDFVEGNVKETSLVRQSVENDSRPVRILPATQTTIFNFAWSPSGNKLAVSRGQLLRDVVMLTNFE